FFAAWISHRKTRPVTRIVAGGTTPPTFLRTCRPFCALFSPQRSPAIVPAISLTRFSSRVRGDARSLKRDFQKPVQRELKGLGFFLTHGVSPVLAGFLVRNPRKSRRGDY